MSQQNVDAVRRYLEAYNERDFEVLVEATDPDFEFRSRWLRVRRVVRAEVFSDRAEALDAVGLPLR
jgi:hypothetical protein